MGEDLFSLETTDNLPNVTTLNLNWLLGEAVRSCPRRFVPCLRLLVRKSSAPAPCLAKLCGVHSSMMMMEVI